MRSRSSRPRLWLVPVGPSLSYRLATRLSAHAPREAGRSAATSSDGSPAVQVAQVYSACHPTCDVRGRDPRVPLYVDYGRGTGCAIRRAVAGVGAKRRDHLRVIPRNRSAGRWDRRGGNARSAPTRPRPGVSGRSASSRSRTDDDSTRLRAQPAATALEGSSLQ